jgi:septum formation topological specificity factor MinE
MSKKKQTNETSNLLQKIENRSPNIDTNKKHFIELSDREIDDIRQNNKQYTKTHDKQYLERNHKLLRQKLRILLNHPRKEDIIEHTVSVFHPQLFHKIICKYINSHPELITQESTNIYSVELIEDYKILVLARENTHYDNYKYYDCNKLIITIRFKDNLYDIRGYNEDEISKNIKNYNVDTIVNSNNFLQYINNILL